MATTNATAPSLQNMWRQSGYYTDCVPSSTCTNSAATSPYVRVDRKPRHSSSCNRELSFSSWLIFILLTINTGAQSTAQDGLWLGRSRVDFPDSRHAAALSTEYSLCLRLVAYCRRVSIEYERHCSYQLTFPAVTKDRPTEDLHPAALPAPKLCLFMHQAELTLL